MVKLLNTKFFVALLACLAVVLRPRRAAGAVGNRMIKVTVVNLLDGEERPRGRSARHQVQNRYFGYTLAANFVKGGVYGIAAPS